MDNSKQVLIVTNSIMEEEVAQIRKAFSTEFAPGTPVRLTLVHVIPRLPTNYFTIPAVGMLIQKYYDEAKNTLTTVGTRLGIAKNDQWLISGKIRTEVLRLANKLGSNFILASAQQITELQRSLFFKDIDQLAVIKNIKQLETIG